jgi:hypothetical protein
MGIREKGNGERRVEGEMMVRVSGREKRKKRELTGVDCRKQ